MSKDYIHSILSPDLDFDTMAAAVWEYQYQHNSVLHRYCNLLGLRENVFLPISFFKDFEIKTGTWETETVFESSGTTGQIPSRHFVKDISLYREIGVAGFYHFFPQKKYKILALLPSYIERNSASLVRMVTDWINAFGSPGSGFYLYNFNELEKAIYESEGENILLIGVTFALLDFAEQLKYPLPQNTIVIETGGMKGKREEITRNELHKKLSTSFGLKQIASEYGMTELMSQAYSLKDGRFVCPPWMRIIVSDIHLPSKILPYGNTGRINIIDLANFHSCAFLSTDDIGILHENGEFEVLGRIELSENRGCSLMYV